LEGGACDEEDDEEEEEAEAGANPAGYGMPG
jgi:hypothetical protein